MTGARHRSVCPAPVDRPAGTLLLRRRL